VKWGEAGGGFSKKVLPKLWQLFAGLDDGTILHFCDPLDVVESIAAFRCSLVNAPDSLPVMNIARDDLRGAYGAV
jgi:hypothetical protein